MLRNSCVQQFHKISNWTILINIEIGGNVKAFKIKLTSVQCCLLQISRNVAIFERLPSGLFQVFFQDSENKSHTYLKKPVFCCWWSFFPVAESRRGQSCTWKISASVLCGFVLGQGCCFWRVRCRSRGVQGGPSLSLPVLGCRAH